MNDVATERKVIITSPYDGGRIPAVLNEPSGGMEIVYLLLHGLTTDKDEYLNFYVQVADRLARAGIGTLRLDFRGHGESKAPVTEFTILNSASDVLSCSLWLKEKHPDVRQNILGTSFGAAAGIVASASMPTWYSRLSLLAPVLNLHELYIAPVHKARESYKDFRNISLAQAERHQIDDRRSFGYLNALEFVAIDLVRLVRDQRVPTVVMHGTADTMVPYEGTVKSLVDSKVRLMSFENMDHGYMDIEDADGHGQKSQENLDRIIAELT